LTLKIEISTLFIEFSRAVRVENIISVSGTAAIAPDGSTAWPDDVYE
jgi:hypothetical protein